MKIDKSIIKELSDYLDEFNLTEIEITEKDTKIKVSKNNISISNQPVTTSASQVIKNEWVLFDETAVWKQILLKTG